MQLYSYFRSTAAYRVRIALNLKGLSATQIPVNLVAGGQKDPSYTALNPQGLVPALVLESGQVLNQSLAILEYLEEQHATPALLPNEPIDRAWVRGIAYEIACDMHPLNNLRVLKYLEQQAGLSAAAKQTWYEHWVAEGFNALEQRLSQRTPTQQGAFCFGDTPTLADCLLIPQVFNALRFNCDMQPYPLITHIYKHCLTIDAFDQARPEKQPDAPSL